MQKVMRKVITLMILTATLGRISYSGHTETLLDRHTAGDTELYDIATDWKE